MPNDSKAGSHKPESSGLGDETLIAAANDQQYYEYGWYPFGGAPTERFKLAAEPWNQPMQELGYTWYPFGAPLI
ncbi:hypothetical protein [Aquisediminimonas profunda]|uniref:hypothetical protein n=1 Tax=Aquisediminimonas profunda TaxID=1550733 RepID=UPI001C63B80D|nr:hypothetical protein [Aquisediminimonas profunda]